MGFARLLDALRLLGRAHLAFGRLHRGRRGARARFRFRQRLLRPRHPGLACADPRARSHDLGLPAVAFGVRLGDAPLDFHRLAPDRLELRAHAAAVFAQERDLLLERLHLGVGGVEGPLELLQTIGFLVVAAAQLLERSLGLAQLRQLGFEGHLDLLRLVGVAIAGLLGLAQARKGEEVLVERELRLQVLVLRRDLGLLAEARELGVELGADVAHARQVLARVLEPQLGLAAPLAVLGDAGGLLQEHPQLLGLGGDDPRDHALLDDRVGAGAEAGAKEDVLHVAATHVLGVDVVVGVAVAREHPLHADLGVTRPGTADPPERVVEHQLHRSP